MGLFVEIPEETVSIEVKQSDVIWEYEIHSKSAVDIEAQVKVTATANGNEIYNINAPTVSVPTGKAIAQSGRFAHSESAGTQIQFCAELIKEEEIGRA